MAKQTKSAADGAANIGDVTIRGTYIIWAVGIVILTFAVCTVALVLQLTPPKSIPADTLMVTVGAAAAILFWVVRDITERKSAQEVLRRSKEDLERLVRERTADLEHANIQFRSEIRERERVEAERQKTLLKLRAALDEIKTLSGLIPICASCKKVRDDGGYWKQIEVYISAHSDADFSHSLCPGCVDKLYPELDLNNE